MTLDLEWSGTAAPGATLDAVYAPDGASSNGYSPSDATMEDAVNDAVSSIAGVDVISMSFGSLDGQDPSFQAALSVSFAKAAMEGITVLGASGDTGGDSAGTCSGGPAPQFPRLAVRRRRRRDRAGASLDLQGSVTGLDSEPAWSLSGGGYSNQYAAQPWELVGSAAGPIHTYGNGHRGMPDVAGGGPEHLLLRRVDRVRLGNELRDADVGRPRRGDGCGAGNAGRVHHAPTLPGRRRGARGDERRRPRRHHERLDVRRHGRPRLGRRDRVGQPPSAPALRAPRGHLRQREPLGEPVSRGAGPKREDHGPGGQRVERPADPRPARRLQRRRSVLGPCSSFTPSNGTTGPTGSANASIGVSACYFGNSVTVDVDVESDGYYGSNSTTLAVNLLGFSGFLALAQTFPYDIVAFALIMVAALGVGLAGDGAAAPAPGSCTVD